VGTRRSRPLSDPEADEHQDPHAEEQADEALTHRADPAEGEATRVGRVLDDPVDVGGDVPASVLVMLPDPNRGMLPGPDRMASTTWVVVARWRLGA
jgi:hypothetical protein